MIPPFDHNNVLPPFLTNPALPYSQSPYPCDILEFCKRFATSAARKKIIKGFLSFRLDCVTNGIKGVQWVDGSFVEDIENSENRDPHDIDAVSLIIVKDLNEEKMIYSSFPEFTDSRLSKQKYYVDHYVMVINKDPLETVRLTKYWSALFCHNRRGVWKGMLEIPIYNVKDRDLEAMDYINSL